ncbi:MAG: hypothetical protein ACE5H3_07950 [Planctomycetota bacterium]
MGLPELDAVPCRKGLETLLGTPLAMESDIFEKRGNRIPVRFRRTEIKLGHFQPALNLGNPSGIKRHKAAALRGEPWPAGMP